MLLPLLLLLAAVSASPRGDGDMLNPLEDESPATMSIPVEENPTDPPSTERSRPIKRYQILHVEFERVKTPFIIGIWIVCASLAKIGELNQLNVKIFFLVCK